MASTSDGSIASSCAGGVVAAGVHVVRVERDDGGTDRQLRLGVLALGALVEPRGQRDRGHDAEDEHADEQLHEREAASVGERA